MHLYLGEGKALFQSSSTQSSRIVGAKQGGKKKMLFLGFRFHREERGEGETYLLATPVREGAGSEDRKKNI